MNERDFFYWLRGFFELTETNGSIENLTVEQINMIKNHMDLVLAPLIPTDAIWEKPFEPQTICDANPGVITTPINHLTC